MIENPYRMIRRRLKLSGRALGMSASTVSRIESGQYEELSDGMVGALYLAVADAGADIDVLAAELEETFGTAYLDEAYLRWRRMKRKSEGDRTQWPRLEGVWGRTLLGESPMGAFTRLVSGTVERFCSRFCLQAPTLARYIEGKFDYLEPPAIVREALTDAGYDELEELFEMQRKWIDRERSRAADRADRHAG